MQPAPRWEYGTRVSSLPGDENVRGEGPGKQEWPSSIMSKGGERERELEWKQKVSTEPRQTVRPGLEERHKKDL